MSSRSSMSTNPAAKRVQVDLAKFQADHAAHRMFHIEPAREDGDLFTLKGHVYGPPGTPYQGGVFHLEMTIPPTYPFQSPTVRMTTKVWHPNIDESGHVCLDILSNRWTAAMSICTTMMSIQALLCSPNADDGLNDVAAEQLMENPNDYEKTVCFWTYHYAVKADDRTVEMVNTNEPLEAIVSRVMALTGKDFDSALSLLSYYNWDQKIVISNHGKSDSEQSGSRNHHSSSAED